MAGCNEEMQKCSKEDLVNRIRQLEAHVAQLRNIVAKNQSTATHKQGQCQRKQQRPFDFSKHNKRHVALKIAYLGWDYHGFAVQEDDMKTIETALFDALIRTRLIESRETSNYHRCGRTDKGVSAFSQVISLDLRSNVDGGIGLVSSGTTKEAETQTNPQKFELEKEIRYVHILNKVLPSEIRVLAWAPVETTFSARFSCTQRTYKYYFAKGDLDVDSMQEACQLLIGKHDFRNFCKMDVGNGVTNFVRMVFSATIQPAFEKSIEGDSYMLYELTLVGQAFLWHQVRCIVAVLFLIGRRKESPLVISQLLDTEQYPCKPQYSMASELPLVLFDCEFDNIEWQFDTEAYGMVIEDLQQEWTRNAVKATMVKKMLTQLESSSIVSSELKRQNDCLTAGLEAKLYKPLLTRPTCEKLEDRIRHYQKKFKLTM